MWACRYCLVGIAVLATGLIESMASRAAEGVWVRVGTKEKDPVGWHGHHFGKSIIYLHHGYDNEYGMISQFSPSKIHKERFDQGS